MSRIGVLMTTVLTVMWFGQSRAALEPMSDEALSSVSGQALFVADKIGPTGGGSGASPTDFTFYRVGLDALLELNMNIDEFKLGCGGVNDQLTSSVCDIDMDYVRFMGRGAGQTSPDGEPIPGAGQPVQDDFELLRPYLEIAVRNDDSRTGREVVGLKIGAESADGYFGAGQVECRGNDPACHSGVNAISGFLNIELSAEVPMTVGAFGDTVGCIGDVRNGQDCPRDTPYYIDNSRSTGTRMTAVQAPGVPINLEGGFVSILGDAYGNMIEDLSFVHGFQLQDTSDFFMSFQREQVSYPSFDKSGYAVAANTGWWMNVPNVKLVDIRSPHIDVPCGFFGCLGALGEPGAVVENIELNSSPPDNCYGPTLFC